MDFVAISKVWMAVVVINLVVVWVVVVVEVVVANGVVVVVDIVVVDLIVGIVEETVGWTHPPSIEISAQFMNSSCGPIPRPLWPFSVPFYDAKNYMLILSVVIKLKILPSYFHPDISTVKHNVDNLCHQAVWHFKNKFFFFNLLKIMRFLKGEI